MTSRISGGLAWQALDSRGTPTVACELRLESGASGRVVVPAGASKGRHEAVELRDGGLAFGGMGVSGAVANVNSVLIPAVVGRQLRSQAELDDLLCELDGSSTLARLGANAVLAVSLAWSLASARDSGVELYRALAGDGELLLPLPMVNIVSGGAHADRALDIQDVLAVPLAAATFAEAIDHVARVRSATSRLAASRGLHTSLVADEGGLGLGLATNRAAIELVTEAIEAAGLDPGPDVGIAVDIAANQLESDGGYHLGIEDRQLTGGQLIDEIAGWCRDYPIVSIEDPLSDEDWDGWVAATERLAHIQLIGDDFFATDPDRFCTGRDRKIANAVLIKPNQAGSLTRAAEVVDLATAAGYARVVSARSGDTEDTWLADLAVGWGSGQIKVGSLMRSERTAKWNRLLEIEAREQGRIRYAGAAALSSIAPST